MQQASRDSFCFFQNSIEVSQNCKETKYQSNERNNLNWSNVDGPWSSSRPMGILSWAIYDGIESSRPLASLDHFHRGKSTDISYIIILYRAVFLASWAPELCRTCHDSLMHVLKGGIRKTLLTPHFSGVWLFLCTFLWRSSKNWINSTQQLMNFFLKATIWVCLKIGYIPNYSHLIGIMIINHWV